MLKILVACEWSQKVTEALIKKGHNAVSCDNQHEGALGYPHYLGSVLDILYSEQWDAIIAFPPCTDLAVSGAHLFAEKIRDGRQQLSVDFFMKFANHPAKMKLIENPVGIMSTLWRKPDQIVHPYMFGHDASKKTCIWVEGLQLLTPTILIAPRMVNGLPRWGNQTDSGQNRLGPSEKRAQERGETYQGIADAIANLF